MISYLSGKIVFKSSSLKKDNFLVLDVGGVGYKAFVLDKTINESRVGDNLVLHVYTQVAETALDLYGFVSREELEFFELLLTISGIGPRSALDIMKKTKIDDLQQGVLSGDFNLLSKLSGIGPKTAEKIVIGLKDKIGIVATSAVVGASSDFNDALEALMTFGYSAAQARDALMKCTAEDTGEKIKEALKFLGGR